MCSQQCRFPGIGKGLIHCLCPAVQSSVSLYSWKSEYSSHGSCGEIMAFFVRFVQQDRECTAANCTAGAGALGRIVVIRQRCWPLPSDHLSYWLARFLFGEPLLKMEVRLQPIGQAGPKLATPGNGEATMDHPCTGRKSMTPARPKPRGAARQPPTTYHQGKAF